MAALPLLLVSCQQEELPEMNGTSDTTPLSITVNDGGYTSIGKPVTRATENGYTTEFTGGDACGLYIVRNGVVVYNNVKLTATVGTDGSLSWQPETDVTLAGGLLDEYYFLYYPYQADMINKITPSATDDATFFAPLISDWQPKTDQSDYAAGYTASDLMTATGSTTQADGKLSLSFAMTHRMALAVIETPTIETVYHFTNATGGAIPDYTVQTPIVAEFISETKAYRTTDGSYRYIVRPDQSDATPLTGNYDHGMKEFTIAPNSLRAGSYNTYRIVGKSTIEKSHNLQVGDYLLSDGSLISKDETLTPEQKAKVSAIVFWSPAETDYTNRQNPASLTDDKIMAADYPNCNHGLAVAVTEMSCRWQNPWNRNQAVSVWQDKNFTHDNKEDFVSVKYNFNNIKIYGYQNTVVLRTYNSKNRSFIILPVYNLISFSETNPAPDGSTGWFIPSVKETYMLCNKDVDNLSTNSETTTRNIVNTSLIQINKVSLQSGVNYWTSTENQAGTAYRVFFTNAQCGSMDKTISAYARPVCAF